MSKWLVLFSMTMIFSMGASEKQTICLNMVVNNEKTTIKSCLDSVKPLINYWVIIDTGSTDGTQSLIQECLKDIPGELYEKAVKSPEDTFNEALQLSKEKADYILFVSGKGRFERDTSFRLDLSKDVYCIWRDKASYSCLRRQLVKASLPWKWDKGSLDFLSCDTPCSSDVLEGIRYVLGEDEPCEVPQLQSYFSLLQKELESDPDNCLNIMLLAEAYRGAGEKEKALEWYKRRINKTSNNQLLEDQNKQDVFWSLFQIAKLQQELGYSTDSVIEAYYRAHRFRPHRIEPIYHLAKLYNQQKQFDLAYACIKSRAFIRQPRLKDTYYVTYGMEEYGLLFELSICSYWVENYQESMEASQTLLKMEKIPESMKNQAMKNRDFAFQKIQQKAGKEEVRK